MEEDQVDSARNKLRLAAAVVVFGVFMGLRHFFLAAQGPLDVPLWFWLTLALSAGMLVGAVEFEGGLLEVYGLLIGAVSSVVGAAFSGLLIVYMCFALKVWEDILRALNALFGRGPGFVWEDTLPKINAIFSRGPGLMFAGFLMGTVLTGPIVWSFAQELLGNQRANGRTSDSDDE